MSSFGGGSERAKLSRFSDVFSTCLHNIYVLSLSQRITEVQSKPKISKPFQDVQTHMNKYGVNTSEPIWKPCEYEAVKEKLTFANPEESLARSWSEHARSFCVSSSTKYMSIYTYLHV